MRPKPSRAAGSGPNSITRGSVRRDVRSCAATGRIRAGATPSTSGEAAAAATTRSAASASNRPAAVLASISSAGSTSAPAASTVSSVAPSERRTDERMVRPMVSPVTREEAMMGVDSMTQLAAAPPAAPVADRHETAARVTGGGPPDEAEGHGQDHHQGGGEGPDRDAEDPFHRSSPGRHRGVGQGDLVVLAAGRGGEQRQV